MVDGQPPRPPACRMPKPRTTSPIQSRIMESDGFLQNAQAAVDAAAQIIVAQDVSQSAVDCGQLVPQIGAIEANLGRKPAQLSVDAGHCSEANLAALEARNIDGCLATGRAQARGFRQFLMRGFDKVRAVGHRLHHHNLVKLAHRLIVPQPLKKAAGVTNQVAPSSNPFKSFAYLHSPR
jgi:hypothetical protein